MSILNSIINEAWAIDPKYASAYLPFVQSLIEGKNPDKLLPQNQEVKISYIETSEVMSASGERSSSVSSGKRIAVFTVKGVLTKDDGFCSAGMESMDIMLKQVLNDPEVGGVLLNMDTPGGEASYTPIFARTINQASKPIITYTNRLLASAGYWIASNSREIYASHDNDTIGSIGTMVTLVDFRKKMEMDGINMVDIYATESEEKNHLYKAFLKGDIDTIRKEMLDPVNESFLNTVRSNRDITDSKAFKGKTFLGKQAIKIGMIDGIKSFEECIARLEELISSSDKPQNTPKTNSNMKKEIQTVATFLGYEKLESKDGHISLSEEDFAKIGAKLESIETAESSAENSDKDKPGTENSAFEAISKQLDTIQSSTSKLEENLTKMEGRIDTLEDKKPAAKRSGAEAPDDTETDDEAKGNVDAWADPANPLNKQIDEDLQ